jgi:hypothetical protein
VPVPLIAAGVGALGSAVGGALSNRGSGTQMPVLPGASPLQQYLQGGLQGQYGDLAGFMNPGEGPLSGAAAQGAYGQSTSALSQALQQYASQGGMPNQQQIAAGTASAQAQFAPQQQQLQQSFYYQDQGNKRQEALLGRGGNDPILQAKLAQSQGFQQQQLNAQQGAYGNQLAMQMPQNQLGALGQQNQLLGGIYQQALANRQYLLSTGSQLLGQQYGYQLGAAGQQMDFSKGGGLGGAIAGGVAGLGSFADNYAKFGYEYKPTTNAPLDTRNAYSGPQGAALSNGATFIPGYGYR